MIILAVLGLLPFVVRSAAPASSGVLSYADVCSSIAKKISSQSQVYYAPDPEYTSDLYHWMSSSTQDAACIVEVGSDKDISKVMKIVAQNKTPFNVKSGGHASNPGFSSTPGVQISLTRINQVKLSPDNSSVNIGLGNIWSDVYSSLQGTGYNVVGGRVTGPGTGGFTLGGGYSWLTNQAGLTCDTALSYNLILPNGTITTVDSKTPDLSFALRGGLNRFGVVSDITYKTIPQVPQVYGGYAIYAPDNVEAVLNATHKFFAVNKDPKAQVITTLDGGSTGVTGIVLFFYDGPKRPAAFAPFNNIPTLLNQVKKQTFASFAAAAPSKAEAGHRGAFHTLGTTKLTPGYLAAVYNETQFYSKGSLLHDAQILSYDIEPFNTDYGKFATDSAYPHADSPLPLNLYFGWDGEANDKYWLDIMTASVNHLIKVAKAEGIYSSGAAYPNYALSSYTGDQLYGPKNAARLRSIRDKIDPDRIMDLAGGFVL